MQEIHPVILIWGVTVFSDVRVQRKKKANVFACITNFYIYSEATNPVSLR